VRAPERRDIPVIINFHGGAATARPSRSIR
jgi:hypothetical protein